MNDLNPYADIEKVPLYAEDQMQSRGYSVRIEDPGADTGWREVGLVSDQYLLVPNERAHQMAWEIAERSPFRWEEEKVYFDGKRFLYALTTRSDASVEVEVGDTVGLGLLFENSYDGSRKLAARLFACRLACSNGMLTKEHFTGMRFKHDNTGRGWEEEIERALFMLSCAEEELTAFAASARRLTQHRLGSEELQVIRREALARLPLTLWGKTLDRYLEYEAHTGWGLLNAATNVLWHGDRSTLSDFGHNERTTAGLLRYAAEELDGDGLPFSGDPSAGDGTEHASWVYERDA